MSRRIYEMQAELCRALSHPIRLEILDILASGEKSVDELTKETSASQANVSQHLAVLRKQRLVNARREGMNVYYSIAHPKIVSACTLVKQLLTELLSREHELLRPYVKRK